jgi:hypothetical protein
MGAAAQARRRVSVVTPPGPGIPEPDRRQEVERQADRRGYDGDPAQHIFREAFALDEDIEVAVVVEDAVSSSSHGPWWPRLRFSRRAVAWKRLLRILARYLHECVGVLSR